MAYFTNTLYLSIPNVTTLKLAYIIQSESRERVNRLHQALVHKIEKIFNLVIPPDLPLLKLSSLTLSSNEAYPPVELILPLELQGCFEQQGHDSTTSLYADVLISGHESIRYVL